MTDIKDVDVSKLYVRTPELAKLCCANYPHRWELPLVSPEFFKSLGTRAKRLLEIGMIHDYLESLKFEIIGWNINNRCSILKDETWIMVTFNPDFILIEERFKGVTVNASYYEYNNILEYTKFFNTMI